MTENYNTKKERLSLRYCRYCGTKTIHKSTKIFNEIDYVSTVTHKCLLCDTIIRKTIKHDDFIGVQFINTPKGTPCNFCGKIIQGKGHIVNDTMGMSGGLYHVCSKKCADGLMMDNYI